MGFETHLETRSGPWRVCPDEHRCGRSSLMMFESPRREAIRSWTGAGAGPPRVVCPTWKALRLHHNRNDHRSSAVLLADPLTDDATNQLLELVRIGNARPQGILDGCQHR